MNISNCKSLLLLIFITLNYKGWSQTARKDYPVVGEPIPEFRLSDVHYYSANVFDSKKVAGKWTILDFWNTHCSVCVQSFPKVDQMQSKFKDNIKFLLIGQNDHKYNKNIKESFERYRKHFGLNLSIAYDSVLFDKFGVASVPHVVIINPQGRVYAITYSSSLNFESLQALIEGKEPAFPEKKDAPGARRLSHWHYLLNNKARDSDFLFRTIISRYKGEMREGAEIIDQYRENGFFQVTQATLSSLYKFAWFGQPEWVSWDTLYSTHWKSPILEVSDSSQFQFNYDKGTGYYNYSLSMPKEQSTKEHLMEMMQRDLKNYFGYDASVETRMMPYWKLMSTNEARKALKSKNKKQEIFDAGSAGIEGKGLTVDFIIQLIAQYYKDQIPIINETGITEPIDIKFTAVMTDMEDVQKALKKHGLILEKAEKRFKVLVIKDPKEESKTF